MIQLASHFRDNERRRHSERLHQRKWFIKAKQDQEERAEKAEQAEAEFIALAGTVIVATEIQLQEFQQRLVNYETSLDAYDTKLDMYDEAVAHALMEQISRLDILQAEKQAMLDSAFTLEDGRKVFRSRDGSFAVDETGDTLNQLEFESNDIPEGPISAEDYLTKLEAIDSTQQRIDELHIAQQEIDAAKEQSADARNVLKRGQKLAGTEDVTVDELDDLDAKLEAAMPKALPNIPASAMKYISGVENASAPSIKQNFAGVASDAQVGIQSTQLPSPAGIELGG